jgi:hypothetical protein
MKKYEKDILTRKRHTDPDRRTEKNKKTQKQESKIKSAQTQPS